ncbi:hypothetical protein ACTHGU_14760 [Chitinophagaceae bacterium MMS25-I14]
MKATENQLPAPVLSEKLKHAVMIFFNTFPPAETSRMLRTFLLDYIYQNRTPVIIDVEEDLSHFAHIFHDLFELLDTAHTETMDWRS